MIRDNVRITLDALSELQKEYITILRVNLVNETYISIKNDDANTPENIKDWVQQFIDSNQIKKEDLNEFRLFSRLDIIRKHFHHSDQRLFLKYRRIIDEDQKKYTWVFCTLSKLPDFRNYENEQILLAIREAEKEMCDLIDYQVVLESYSFKDELTQIGNRRAFDEFCTSININCPYGIIYIDLNRLKYINDTEGHVAGDNYIKNAAEIIQKTFRAEECYRIGGDEFIVLIPSISKRSLEYRVKTFQNNLKQSNISAAFGYHFQNNGVNIRRGIIKAEEMMYNNKEEYYALSNVKRRTE